MVYGRRAVIAAPPASGFYSMMPAKEFAETKLKETESGTTFTCVQEAGDVVLLPDFWSHMTLNLDTSVSVAQGFNMR